MVWETSSATNTEAWLEVPGDDGAGGGNGWVAGFHFVVCIFHHRSSGLVAVVGTIVGTVVGVQGSAPNLWAHAGTFRKIILGTEPLRPSTYRTPGHDQQVLILIQDKHGSLFADLANEELSDGSKKVRFASKPYKDIKFILSGWSESEITLIFASSYKI